MADIKILTKLWDQIDPMSIESYRKKGGYESARITMREKRPAEVIDEIKRSGLQGRGGAGFITGDKWEIASKVPGDERYLICNLDESEPGTFKDLSLAMNNPHQILEGMIIAGYAVGAKKGYIYLNGKFKQAQHILETAIREAYERNLLGRTVMGFAVDLDIEIFMGAGAYICGEESALINSMEGMRGEPRLRPPYPCSCGLSGRPTVVNNAETLSWIPWIMKNGAEKFRAIGTAKSPGTKLFSVDGAVKHPGIYEAPIGTTIRDLIFDYAKGMEQGKKFWFAQIGGSSGRIAMENQLDEVPSYSREAAIPMGSGAVLVVDRSHDIREYLMSVVSFFHRESCGKCVPCREGTFRLHALVDRLRTGDFTPRERIEVEKIIWTLDNTTFCPLGKFSVIALKDIIKYKLIKELI